MVARTQGTSTGRPVPCTDGKADGFDCRNVELLSFLTVQDLGGTQKTELNDIWGWEDTSTGREYALIGRSDGVSFVDITDPVNPVYLGNLPLTRGANVSSWRTIKVYSNHVFVAADGAGKHGMQVFDLTRLRDAGGTPETFTPDYVYDRIHSTHNIVINEDKGVAFAVGSNGGGESCGGALHMIDVREPKSPAFLGCFADRQTGLQRTGYTHDAQCVTYGGPDARYQDREICFNGSETMLGIADVTNKKKPVVVARAAYPHVAYAHQGWLTADQKYFYMNDELDEMTGLVRRTRTIIWDVTDLDDPQVVGEYFGGTGAVDHNLYVRGDTMYQSNYTAGLRVIDISDRKNPKEIGFFDSVPGTDNPIFEGTWSNYPFFRSGTIVFSSIREGLFIVRMQPSAS